MIKRSAWNAKEAKDRGKFSYTPSYIVVHHSETPECFSEAGCKARVKNIQRFHMDNRGWSDIGYNFLVRKIVYNKFERHFSIFKGWCYQIFSQL